MNSVVIQTLRCPIHDTKSTNDGEKVLPTVGMAINPLPYSTTGFSPFFINYGYEPITLIQLLRGNEEIKTENVVSFTQSVKYDEILEKENLNRLMNLQAKYYDRKLRGIIFEGGNPVLLSTCNLEMKVVPQKIKKTFVVLFKIIQRMGQQAYKLLLPDTWKIHSVFHVSLTNRMECCKFTGRRTTSRR